MGFDFLFDCNSEININIIFLSKCYIQVHLNKLECCGKVHLFQ